MISTWIPQLLTLRATPSSLIDSPVLPIDSFTISHVLLRNRHCPNQSHVSFASKCMVLKLAILTSVKRPHPSSMVLPKYLLRSERFNTNWPIFNNLQAICVTPHYNVVHAWAYKTACMLRIRGMGKLSTVCSPRYPKETMTTNTATWTNLFYAGLSTREVVEW